MALIKDHQFIDDSWVYYEPNLESREQTTGVIFNLQNFTACSHNIPDSLNLGIKLANHDPTALIQDHVNQLKLVILEFPAFVDGRAYSQAQSLREQQGFDGEIRATGNVLIDQYAFMLQCGFTSFEVPQSIDIERWKAAARLVPTTYSKTQAKNYSHIWKLRKVLNN